MNTIIVFLALTDPFRLMSATLWIRVWGQKRKQGVTGASDFAKFGYGDILASGQNQKKKIEIKNLSFLNKFVISPKSHDFQRNICKM